ncbi:MAG: hypothetical protein M1840_002661 [Geoglossum simile]|nr:MAG: hypothetical protein M1840_002661 [Geoglossum simile]
MTNGTRSPTAASYPQAMTSPSVPSTQDVKEAIEKDGFYYHLDPTIGNQVNEFAEEGYPFLTEKGLDFIKCHTLDDKVNQYTPLHYYFGLTISQHVCEVLESVFLWSGLGFCQKYDRHPGRTFSFANYTGTRVRALMVQLWSTGSQAVFYKGSHLQSLEKIDTNGLLEIPHEYLHKDAIERTEVEMKNGALVILDDRLGFTIVQGFAITFGFAVEEELNIYAKIRLPNLPGLKKRVASMTSKSIGTNFEFFG